MPGYLFISVPVIYVTKLRLEHCLKFYNYYERLLKPDTCHITASSSTNLTRRAEHRRVYTDCHRKRKLWFSVNWAQYAIGYCFYRDWQPSFDGRFLHFILLHSKASQHQTQPLLLIVLDQTVVFVQKRAASRVK